MQSASSDSFTPGTIRAGTALAWGWRTAVGNWRLWVPLSAIGIAAIALSFVLLPVTTPLVIAALIIPISSVTALRQTRERRLRLTQVRATEYQETLLTSLFVVAACVGVLTAWSTAVTGPLVKLFAARGLNQGAPFYQTGVFWLVAGVIVWINLLAPLASMVMLYAADGMSVWRAARPGMRAGLRNYGALLAISLASTVLNLVGLALAGLGLLLTLPFSLLAFAHAYMQASGQPLPEEATS